MSFKERRLLAVAMLGREFVRRPVGISLCELPGQGRAGRSSLRRGGRRERTDDAPSDDGIRQYGATVGELGKGPLRQENRSQSDGKFDLSDIAPDEGRHEPGETDRKPSPVRQDRKTGQAEIHSSAQPLIGFEFMVLDSVAAVLVFLGKPRLVADHPFHKAVGQMESGVGPAPAAVEVKGCRAGDECCPDGEKPGIGNTARPGGRRESRVARSIKAAAPVTAPARSDPSKTSDSITRPRCRPTPPERTSSIGRWRAPVSSRSFKRAPKASAASPAIQLLAICSGTIDARISASGSSHPSEALGENAIVPTMVQAARVSPA